MVGGSKTKFLIKCPGEDETCLYKSTKVSNYSINSSEIFLDGIPQKHGLSGLKSSLVCGNKNMD